MHNPYPILKTACLKKILLTVLLLLGSVASRAQESMPLKPVKKNYFQWELAAPIKQNEAFGEDEEQPFFRPGGAYLRVGFGRRVVDWMSLGLHTGIEWKSDPGLVSAPVFGNIKIAPKLSQDDEVRPFVSFGYGKVFVLNKDRFSGNFLRGNLGLDVAVLSENEERQKGVLSVFIEISYYHFKPEDFDNLSTFNIGLGYTFL
ncbi:hypothetical protein HYN49_02245 [Flavobacterium pallidum]|uniref:Outer membrane protein beta-barrel domain-containing protein n=2 Tax=Flavobacterium pallidum TaxID=2172098 RepID=A0A2S1SEG0_9FLAO|nr:hypothetical protein HYN49_02245 [Flavobacterium pallidum]